MALHLLQVEKSVLLDLPELVVEHVAGQRMCVPGRHSERPPLQHRQQVPVAYLIEVLEQPLHQLLGLALGQRHLQVELVLEFPHQPARDVLLDQYFGGQQVLTLENEQALAGTDLREGVMSKGLDVLLATA